ncbi:MAG: NMD3-related protein [Promethearchaeota archaeon]
MKLRKFCSKCGKSFSASDHIYDGFQCEDCFGKIELHIDFPHKIQIRRCTECGAFSIRVNEKMFKWEYLPKEETEIDFLSQLLYKHILFPLEKQHQIHSSLFFQDKVQLAQEKDINARVEFSKDDNFPVEAYDMIIKTRAINCIHCAKKSGGGFDAILQIRIQHSRDKPRLQELLGTIRQIEYEQNRRNVSFFITKVDWVTNGFDLKVSKNAMSRALMNNLKTKFPLEIKHSQKLVGINQENGTKLYRQSTLMRLVPVKKGDKIIFDGLPYTVKHYTHNKVVLIKIPDEKIKHINFEMFQRKKWKFLEEEGEIDVDIEELTKELSEELYVEDSSEEESSEELSEDLPGDDTG